MMRGEETIPVLEEVMQTYLAHYRSPAASDARLKMLELYGKDAVSWNIDKVERKCASKPVQDGQLALDFRPPKVERKRAKRKEWW